MWRRPQVKNSRPGSPESGGGGCAPSSRSSTHRPRKPAFVPPASLNNVYLWYDSASTNQLGSYNLGIAVVGKDGYKAFTYQSGHAAYTIDTGAYPFKGSMRLPLNERDAYMEAEFFHVGCYHGDMRTGLIGRYILSSGSVALEKSSHYYESNRGHQAPCGRGYDPDSDGVI